MNDQKSILIIDYHPELYTAFIELVKQNKYTCSTVKNGLSALRSLHCTRFDLIILEINLPDVNGLGLISMLKRMCPEIPVLVLSDDNTMESIFNALRMGIAGYLFKPVDPPQVLFCVNETFKEQLLKRQKLHGMLKKAPRRVKSPRSWQAELDEVY